jgi:hypothetical protein
MSIPYLLYFRAFGPALALGGISTLLYVVLARVTASPLLMGIRNLMWDLVFLSR